MPPPEERLTSDQLLYNDDEIEDRRYGLCVHFTMPGGVRVELYEPKYELQKKQ